MKFGPTGKNRKPVNPFAAMQTPADKRAQARSEPPQTAAGIGVDRQVPGLGKPRSAKRRRWDAEALGATPQRAGPFAEMARPLASLLPPRTRKDPRRKQGGIDPFGTLDVKPKKVGKPT